MMIEYEPSHYVHMHELRFHHKWMEFHMLYFFIVYIGNIEKLSLTQLNYIYTGARKFLARSTNVVGRLTQEQPISLFEANAGAA